MTRKELAMKHTNWIDHCCQFLQEKQEFPSDISLIVLVEAKCLARRISEKFSYQDQTFIRSQSDMVIRMSINGFKKEVAELETKCASSLQENCKCK